MGQTTVIFDGVSVAPFRPESPDRDYSDTDVPVGTAALICKAAQILRNMGKAVSAPDMDAATKAAKLVTFKAALSAVDTYTDPTEESKFITERTQVLNATADEKTAKIDLVRGFTDAQAESYMNVYNVERSKETPPGTPITLDQAKDALRRKAGRVTQAGVIIADPTAGEANTLLVDERKTAVATVRLDKTMYDELETALDLAAVCNNTCVIDATGLILTSAGSNFVTSGVAAGDLVTVAGLLAKVATRDSATQLTLANPTKEITVAAAFKVRRSAFAAQFSFSTHE